MNRFRQSAALLLRGVAVAGAAGACVGLADVVRALLAGREFVRPGDEIAVVAFYAACFAPFGMLAALVASRFERSRRTLRSLVVFGSVFFFVGALVNVTLLPSFISGQSLAVNALLLMVCVALLHRHHRSQASDDNASLFKWLAAGAAAPTVALLLSIWIPPRDDGQEPHAKTTRESKRPNVLVYVVDTLRADHLGYLGYPKPTSPEIDAFARDATVFTDCRSVSSWTKPAVASLMTSQYPRVHSCIKEDQLLVPEAETLAEIFRAAGWRTAAFVDNPFISPEYGFGQGFAQDDFHHLRASVLSTGTLLGRAISMTRVLLGLSQPFHVDGHGQRGSAVLHQELLAFASTNSEQPWFAYVHAMEPHAPYHPEAADAEAMGFPAVSDYLTAPLQTGILPFHQSPTPTAETLSMLQAQYDGEIRGFSRQFGRLLDELRRRRILETTIIALVADHGEEFHEHGGWRHGHSLHREVIQVPLILRLPDSLGGEATNSRGLRIGGIATLLDLSPTLVELAGIRYFRGDQRPTGGISLVPNLVAVAGRSAEAVPDRTLLAEMTKGLATIDSLAEGNWQLIVAKEPGRESVVSLFDYQLDPDNLHDRSATELLLAAQLRERMDQSFRVFESAALAGGGRALDPETAARLRALGYAGGN